MVVNSFVLNKCSEFYLAKCLLVYEGNKDVWNQNQKAYQNTPQVKKLLLAQEKIDKKESTINMLKQTARSLERKDSVQLAQRCLEYGFTGKSNISVCIQREAQHDKELAIQKLELQKAYVQNKTEPVQEEENLPFLIDFLGDVAVGIAEGMTDPAFYMHLQSINLRQIKIKIYIEL